MDKSVIGIVVMGIILAGICLAVWKVMLNPKSQPPNMAFLEALIERYLK